MRRLTWLFVMICVSASGIFAQVPDTVVVAVDQIGGKTEFLTDSTTVRFYGLYYYADTSSFSPTPIADAAGWKYNGPGAAWTAPDNNSHAVEIDGVPLIADFNSSHEYTFTYYGPDKDVTIRVIEAQQNPGWYQDNMHVAGDPLRFNIEPDPSVMILGFEAPTQITTQFMSVDTVFAALANTPSNGPISFKIVVEWANLNLTEVYSPNSTVELTVNSPTPGRTIIVGNTTAPIQAGQLLAFELEASEPFGTVGQICIASAEFDAGKIDVTEGILCVNQTVTNTFNISGYITDISGAAVEGAALVLVGTTNPFDATSNANGFYEFTDIPSENYTLSASAERYPPGSSAITSFDALIVAEHDAEISTLDGNALLAADVDRDKRATHLDASLLLRSAASFAPHASYDSSGVPINLTGNVSFSPLNADVAQDFTLLYLGDVDAIGTTALAKTSTQVASESDLYFGFALQFGMDEFVVPVVFKGGYTAKALDLLIEYNKSDVTFVGAESFVGGWQHAVNDSVVGMIDVAMYSTSGTDDSTEVVWLRFESKVQLSSLELSSAINGTGQAVTGTHLQKLAFTVDAHASSDYLQVEVGDSVAVNHLANDAAASGIADYQIVVPPRNQLIESEDGTLYYRASDEYDDWFSYRVISSAGDTSNIATVDIEVGEIENYYPHVALDFSTLFVGVGESYLIDLRTVFGDIDGDSLAFYYSYTANGAIVIEHTNDPFMIRIKCLKPEHAIVQLQALEQGTYSRSVLESFVVTGTVTTGVKDENGGDVLPNEFQLLQNYPNPFNPSTNILFALPHQSEVSLKIYNIQGQLVRSLVEGVYNAGLHTLRWNAKDNHGRSVGTGPYFVLFKAGTYTQRIKISYVK